MVLQTLCPQEGKGKCREGAVNNGSESPKESDSAADASSGDEFLQNRKLVQCTSNTSLGWDSRITVRFHALDDLDITACCQQEEVLFFCTFCRTFPTL